MKSDFPYASFVIGGLKIMGSLELKVLSEAEMERLHRSTLELLENPGVRINHEGIMEMLARAGAEIKRTDRDGEIEVISDGGKWWVK